MRFDQGVQKKGREWAGIDVGEWVAHQSELVAMKRITGTKCLAQCDL